MLNTYTQRGTIREYPYSTRHRSRVRHTRTQCNFSVRHLSHSPNDSPGPIALRRRRDDGVHLACAAARLAVRGYRHLQSRSVPPRARVLDRRRPCQCRVPRLCGHGRRSRGHIQKRRLNPFNKIVLFVENLKLEREGKPRRRKMEDGPRRVIRGFYVSFCRESSSCLLISCTYE